MEPMDWQAAHLQAVAHVHEQASTADVILAIGDVNLETLQVQTGA